MNSFDKFVYLTICEISLNCFEKKGTFSFKSYLTYCKDMDLSLKDGKLNKREMSDIMEINLSLKDGKLNKREMSDIMEIMGVLDKIYSMTDEENGFYIANYFATCDYELYEKSVRWTRDCFPNSHD